MNYEQHWRKKSVIDLINNTKGLAFQEIINGRGFQLHSPNGIQWLTIHDDLAEGEPIATPSGLDSEFDMIRSRLKDKVTYYFVESKDAVYFMGALNTETNTYFSEKENGDVMYGFWCKDSKINVPAITMASFLVPEENPSLKDYRQASEDLVAGRKGSDKSGIPAGWALIDVNCRAKIIYSFESNVSRLAKLLRELMYPILSSIMDTVIYSGEYEMLKDLIPDTCAFEFTARLNHIKRKIHVVNDQLTDYYIMPFDKESKYDSLVETVVDESFRPFFITNKKAIMESSGRPIPVELRRYFNRWVVKKLGTL